MVFRLGPIPVKVTLWFVIMAVMLAGERDPAFVAIWVGIVFVSVLVHELGHALMGRAFGLVPQIELHGMGGTTSWQNSRELGTARSIAISLAGPFAGFALGLVILLASGSMKNPSPLVGGAVQIALWVNFGWGVLNLVPMLPLDGGNVMRAALNGLTKGRGEKAARIISILIAAGALAFAVVTRSWWIGLLAALFVYSNIQAFRQIDQRAIDLPLATAIQRSYAAVDQQDGATAIALLRPALSPKANAELQQIGMRLFAYALLIEGQWGELMPLLEREHATLGDEELARYARTARELERLDEAARIDALRGLSAAPSGAESG